MKVIDNFDIFPESTNTPSYDPRFRSYDHCNLGVLLEIPSFWTEQLSGQIWMLSLLPMDN
jgi:hypothetical protein